jgi:large subunit ribosomal protein L13
MAKPGATEKKCYLIDAKDKILGRVATAAAHILRGKHRVTYTPNVDTGDMVVIINADKIRVTGNKLLEKTYERYSGYPSGKKVLTLEELLKKAPAKAMELAVNRMIPRNPLGYHVRTKLRVYAGEKHPHQSQKPIVLEVK